MMVYLFNIISVFPRQAELVDLVKDMLQKFGTHHYIANLGHGIYPDMDPKRVKLFVDTVHSYSDFMNSSD